MARKVDDDRLLTVVEVAELLKVTTGTVYGYAAGRRGKDNRLPSLRVGPKLLRFRESDVLEFQRERGLYAHAG